MSKGIAIQTILLILIGVIVVGIITYLVYTVMMTPTLSTKECETRFFSWCTYCMNLGRTSTSPIPTDFYNSCRDKLSTIGITIATTSRCNNIYNECKKVGINY